MIDTGIDKTVWTDPSFNKQFTEANQRYKETPALLSDNDVAVLDKYFGNAAKARAKRADAQQQQALARAPAAAGWTQKDFEEIAAGHCPARLTTEPVPLPIFTGLIPVLGQKDAEQRALINELRRDFISLDRFVRLMVEKESLKHEHISARLDALEQASGGAPSKDIDGALECKEHVPGRTYTAGSFCRRKGHTWRALKDTAISPGLDAASWELYLRGAQAVP